MSSKHSLLLCVAHAQKEIIDQSIKVPKSHRWFKHWSRGESRVIIPWRGEKGMATECPIQDAAT